MANDLAALLLIYTSTGDRAGLEELSRLAVKAGQNNIAFACALQLGDSRECVDVLLATERAPEAALFARTYAPSQAGGAARAWRKALEGAKKPKQAAAIADPAEQPEEFGEGWEEALRREAEVGQGQGLEEEEERYEEPLRPEETEEQREEPQAGELDEEELVEGVNGVSLQETEGQYYQYEGAVNGAGAGSYEEKEDLLA